MLNVLTTRQEFTNKYSGIYNYNPQKPYWLKSEFNDHIWQIEFQLSGKELHKTIIRWSDVVLDDGLKLTNLKHLHLLNAFKYWITAADNPFANGGRLYKPKTVNVAVNVIISLINMILLNGHQISLVKHHLERIDQDFLMSFFVKLAEDSNAYLTIYDFYKRTEILLKENLEQIDHAEAIAYKKKYPFIAENELEDPPLNLTVEERIKACCWLDKKGYYHSINKHRVLKGRAKVIGEMLFKHKIICFDDVNYLRLEELSLRKAGHDHKEYLSVFNLDDEDGLAENFIHYYMRVFKLLSVINHYDDCCNLSDDAFQNITVARVRQHTHVKALGRTNTLPFPVVKKLFSDCFTFCNNHISAILNSAFKIIQMAQAQPNEVVAYVDRNGIKTEATAFNLWMRSSEWHSLIAPSLVKMGVDRLGIIFTQKDKFELLRANKGFADLFSILTGSIQFLLGAMTARRMNELLTLKPFGNLYPNINPESTKGKKTDFSLIFRSKKTGSGGKNAINDEIKRPIPRAIASFLWQIEQFNLKLVKSNLATENDIALLNLLNKKFINLKKLCITSFCENSDLMCDYFESYKVIDNHGKKRRYYVRQHELRRFFAMVFFWSSGYEGLDSIRWMLGHSDTEHLYHYITESQTGGVLKGVKATYLVEALQSKVKLEGIDTLRKLLAERYGVHEFNVHLHPISDAIDRFEDEDEFQTIPMIGDLKKQALLENYIIELLDNDIITLEPEFFSIESADGEKRSMYNLLLKVREIE